jgi:hypothetical protein
VRTRSLVAIPLLIAAVLVAAIFSAWVGLGFGIVLVIVILRLRVDEWLEVSEGFSTYHEPPLARAADCGVGVVRHGLAAIRQRSGRDAVDMLMALAFVLLIFLPLLAVKLASHHHGLGNPLGVTIGVIVGDLVLELQHVPGRLARYRGAAQQHGPVWIVMVVLTLELAIFLYLSATRDAATGGFLRSVFTGVALMAVIHAVTIMTTFVAIFMKGRPLR